MGPSPVRPDSSTTRPPRERKVLIADDHPVVRRGLAAVLAQQSWVGAVLEAGTAADALRCVTLDGADTVILDVLLPDKNGIAVAREILRSRPETAILILTMSNSESMVQRALEAGVKGYVLKDDSPEFIVQATYTVAHGGTVLGASVADGLLTERTALPPPFDSLTPNQLQMTRLLGEGLTNSQIARELRVTEKTVRNQMRPLLDKLRVADRAQAALRAREQGFGRPLG